MTNQIRKITNRAFICGLLIISGALSSFAQSGRGPKTVKDYFKLIPADYFSVFCCDENKDAYIKKYVTVNDSKNGFMDGADLEEDPQYQGFRLKVFSSPSGKTILGLYSHSMRWEDYYFLEDKNGKLQNISGTIPSYSQGNIYDFPRIGTVIKVYKKKFSSPAKKIDVDNTVSRGKYLYSLTWQDGKFAVTK